MTMTKVNQDTFSDPRFGGEDKQDDDHIDNDNDNEDEDDDGGEDDDEDYQDDPG